MQLVRANLKVGSWCALFALAVQLTLSFGHFHRGDLGSGTTSPTLSTSIAGRAILRAVDNGDGPSKPAVPAADYCGICALVNLAGSTVAPATFAIPLPAFASTTVAWPIAETAPASLLHFHAQARAPPVA